MKPNTKTCWENFVPYTTSIMSNVIKNLSNCNSKFCNPSHIEGEMSREQFTILAQLITESPHSFTCSVCDQLSVLECKYILYHT